MSRAAHQANGRPAAPLVGAWEPPRGQDVRTEEVRCGDQLVARVEEDHPMGGDRLARALLAHVMGHRPHPWLAARFRTDVVEHLDRGHWELPIEWMLWWLDREGILHHPGDSMPDAVGVLRSFKAGATGAVAA